jgi:hypothetical protein
VEIGASMIRLAIAFTVTAAVVLALAQLDSRPASAACVVDRPDNDNQYLAGWGRVTTGSFRGVRANIFNYDPYVWHYYAWVQQYVRLDKLGTVLHAHLGWREDFEPYAGTTNRTYWEYKQSPYHSVVFGDEDPNPVIPYTYANYSVEHNGGNPGTLTFKRDGQTLDSISNVQWIPDGAEMNGHTSTLGEQMPGGYLTRSRFEQANIKIGSTWYYFDGPITQITNPTDHGAQKLNSTTFEIWDKDCAI